MEYIKENTVKSPLNYTGGKFKLLPQILPLLPKKIGLFVDLFCGGCNVGVNINAEQVIYNDQMKQIIDLYKKWSEDGIEDTLKYIESQIEKYKLNNENKEGFLELRKQYNTYGDIRDLFILTAFGFNNQIRFNKKGEYNIPFGKRRFNEQMKLNLIKFIKQIKKQKAKFLNQSFETLNPETLPKNTFIYADPPYLITSATYNENGGWNKQMENDLLEYLDNCTKHGIKFALSNVLEISGKTNVILKQWINKRGYNVHHLNYDYNNCSYHKSGKNNGLTDEVLITNY